MTGPVRGLSFGFTVLESQTESLETTSDLSAQDIDKSKFKIAPNLVGITQYINTTPEELKKEIEGKVVLYDIWTYSCINCIRTIPYITAWDEKYSDDGLLVVGIQPEGSKNRAHISTAKIALHK